MILDVNMKLFRHHVIIFKLVMRKPISFKIYSKNRFSDKFKYFFQNLYQ